MLKALCQNGEELALNHKAVTAILTTSRQTGMLCGSLTAAMLTHHQACI